MPISATLAMNGMRQPQARKNSSDTAALMADQGQIGENHAHRRAGLGVGAVPAALVGGGAFGHQQHRPAPLPADGQALAKAQQGEDDRRRDADGGVGRQQPDQRRRDAHQHQCDNQSALAADAVAKVAEHDAAKRPAR